TSAVIPPTTEDLPIPTETAAPQNITSIQDLLRTPTAAQVLAQNAIETISQEISKAVSKSKLVDWKEREALQAEIKNKTRVLLRKYGYPEDARDYVIDNIISTISVEQNNDNE
ncbi:MAG TPA: DUF3387 domain-containing protein, partial [Alphaproteobacteria bacterium]|nr:DUF3387 domain-containing protein [Alphaproteobacteria bacterium]